MSENIEQSRWAVFQLQVRTKHKTILTVKILQVQLVGVTGSDAEAQQKIYNILQHTLYDLRFLKE